MGFTELVTKSLTWHNFISYSRIWYSGCCHRQYHNIDGTTIHATYNNMQIKESKFIRIRD